MKSKREKDKETQIKERRIENFQTIYKTNEIIQTMQPYKLTIPKKLLNMREIYKTPTRTKLPLKIVVEKSRVGSKKRDKSRDKIDLPKIHSPVNIKQVGKSSLLKKSNNLQDSLKKLKKTDKDFSSEKKKPIRKMIGQKEPVKKRENSKPAREVEKENNFYAKSSKDGN